jgi:DNA-binding NarL/FixJ family response regulator
MRGKGLFIKKFRNKEVVEAIDQVMKGNSFFSQELLITYTNFNPHKNPIYCSKPIKT